MQKSKPEVGQIVYSLNVGNAARGNATQELTEMIVTKVGRKYFTCNIEGCPNSRADQFHIDTWEEKSDYSATHKLYTSVQEWEDEKEVNLICGKIRDTFEYGQNNKNIPLMHLRLAWELLGDPAEVEALLKEEDRINKENLRKAADEFCLASDDLVCSTQQLTVAIPEQVSEVVTRVRLDIREYRNKLTNFMLKVKLR